MLTQDFTSASRFAVGTSLFCIAPRTLAITSTCPLDSYCHMLQHLAKGRLPNLLPNRCPKIAWGNRHSQILMQIFFAWSRNCLKISDKIFTSVRIIFMALVVNALGITCIDLEINVLCLVFSKFVDFLNCFFVWFC